MSTFRWLIDTYFLEFVGHILLSVGLFGIFKKMGIKNTWLAFIPFCRYYTLCKELKRTNLFILIMITTFGHLILLYVGSAIFWISLIKNADTTDFIFIQMLEQSMKAGFFALFLDAVYGAAMLIIQYLIGGRLARSFGKEDAIGYAIGYAIVPYGLALFFGYNKSEYESIEDVKYIDEVKE